MQCLFHIFCRYHHLDIHLEDGNSATEGAISSIHGMIFDGLLQNKTPYCWTLLEKAKKKYWKCSMMKKDNLEYRCSICNLEGFSGFKNERKQYWCTVYTFIYNNHSLRFYSCQSMVELWYRTRTCIISWYTSNHKFSYSASSTSGCAQNSTCIICGHVLRIQHIKPLLSRWATSRKNDEIGTCIISWNALYIYASKILLFP